MDNKQLQQFIIPIGILFCAFVVAAIYIPKVFTNISNYTSLSNDIKAKEEQLKQTQSQLDNLKSAEAAVEKKENDVSAADKPFYKPIMSGFDSEAAIAGEFSEILQLIRANTIKMRSINYTYDPGDDAFVKGAPQKFNVAQLDMEMIANYKTFETFLRDLYKHEHFLDIAKVEVTPYEKNKSVLLINFSIKLYAKKG